MITADSLERGWATRHGLERDWSDLAGKPSLFLDRDGTVIENVPYLNDPAQVALVPGVRETIAAFRNSGYAVIVITNQSGVARGLVSPEQYRAVEAAVIEALGPGLVDATYACPSLAKHPWRKPAPGMLLAAAQDHGLWLAGSVMVGDTLTDMKAGAAAGVGTLMHVQTGHGRDELAAVRAWSQERKGTTFPQLAFAASLGELLPAKAGR